MPDAPLTAYIICLHFFQRLTMRSCQYYIVTFSTSIRTSSFVPRWVQKSGWSTEWPVRNKNCTQRRIKLDIIDDNHYFINFQRLKLSLCSFYIFRLFFLVSQRSPNHLLVALQANGDAKIVLYYDVLVSRFLPINAMANQMCRCRW